MRIVGNNFCNNKKYFTKTKMLKTRKALKNKEKTLEALIPLGLNFGGA